MRKAKQCQPLAEADKLFFQKFYEENRKFIYFIALKYTSTPADCDDLVQDTLVRLIKNISTLKGLDRYKIAKYIALTVRTAFIDLEKSKHKEDVVFLDDEGLESVMVAQEPLQDIDDALSAQFSVEKLKTTLPPREWCILEGKYILDLSQEELGDLIGVEPDSVRMLLHRARKKAKCILEQDAVKEGE